MGREALRSILRLAAQAPRRLRPLSSNVRAHRTTVPTRLAFGLSLLAPSGQAHKGTSRRCAAPGNQSNNVAAASRRQFAHRARFACEVQLVRKNVLLPRPARERQASMQQEHRVGGRFFSLRCLRGMRSVSASRCQGNTFLAGGRHVVLERPHRAQRVRGFITRSPGLFVCLPASAASPRMRPNPSLERTHKGRPVKPACSFSVLPGLPLRAAQLKR